MAILSMERKEIGVVGKRPGKVMLLTDDALAVVSAAGYMNRNGNVLAKSLALSPNDIVEVVYSYNKVTRVGTYGIFTVALSSGTFTLNTWENPANELLTDGNIFVGNASNVATGVAVTGDIGITNAGVTSISAGVIENADVNASAAIDFSKLAALTDGNILVGNGSNVAASVAVTGDIGISNAGVTSISAGVIENADVNASAAIDFSKLAALTDGNILVGNGSNVATSVAVTGDIAISNAGVTSISAGVIENADVNASAAIDFSKLAALTDGNILVGNGSNVATSVAVTGDIAISNAGVTSISAGAIENADVNASAAIDFSKLAALTDSQFLVGNGSNVATSVAMSGDMSLANTGAVTLGSVVNASKAATYADEAVIAGMPVLHVFNMVAGATATRTITTSQKIKVIDVWAVLKGTGTASDTVQVKNAAGTAITDALDCNVADQSVVRAGTIDDANDEVAAAANLQCTITDGGSSDVPAIDVFVLCVVVA